MIHDLILISTQREWEIGNELLIVWMEYFEEQKHSGNFWKEIVNGAFLTNEEILVWFDLNLL